MTTLDLVADVGAASVRLVWLPLAAWTAVWALAEAGLWAGRRAHPALRYRAAQAVVLALPLGLAAAALVDVPPLGAPLAPALALVPDLAGPSAAPPVGAQVAAGGAAPSVAAVGLGLLVALWAGLSATRLLRLTGRALALHRLRRALPESAAPGLDHAASCAAEWAGLRRPVRVVATDADVVPMTFGVWRPLVVVPASLAEPELALAHEFVHVRQRDALGQWVEAVVGAVFGVHPGVRRLLCRCDLLREMACDAAVLADPAVNRHAYASLVSSFATSRAPAVPVAVAMAASPSHVHQRLTTMKTLPTGAPARAVWLVAAAALAVGTLAVTAADALAQPAPPAPAPLLVVDGEVSDQTVGDLDPADIHVIEVLKGEAVGARYGAAGAGGVVLVTTRAAAGLPPTADGAGTVSREALASPPRPMPPGLAVEVFVDRDGESTVDFNLSGEGATASPLYIVDGVALDGAPSDLDFDAISSIEVIKGEAARSRYGEAGADGVIRITTQADGVSAEGPEAAVSAAPAQFSLRGVYPNPSADDVSVAFDLPTDAEVQVEVFDLAGRRVRSLDPARTAAGPRRSLRLETADLATGTYAYRLTARTDAQTYTASGTFTVAR